MSACELAEKLRNVQGSAPIRIGLASPGLLTIWAKTGDGLQRIGSLSETHSIAASGETEHVYQ